MEKVYNLDKIKKARTDFVLQEEIIKQFMPLVYKLANKFNCLDIALLDHDDRVQIGMLSIIEAIETYDGSTLFKTHAQNRIRYGLLNERRRQCSAGNFGVCVDSKNGVYAPAKLLSMDFEVYNGMVNNKSFGETYSSTTADKSQDTIRNSLKGECLDEMLSYCNDRELKYFDLVTFGCETQTEVAKKLKTSQTTVRNNIVSAYEKIRNNMSACEVSELLGIYK